VTNLYKMLTKDYDCVLSCTLNTHNWVLYNSCTVYTDTRDCVLTWEYREGSCCHVRVTAITSTAQREQTNHKGEQSTG